MTSDVGHPYSISRRDFLTAPSLDQRSKSFIRARSHTRLVRALRLILPVLTLGIAALYFLSPRIEVSIGDFDASVSSVVIDKGKLRMINPKLEGANNKKGLYVVTAAYAEQAITNPDIIELTELKAEMKDGKKGWSRLTAPKGKFATKTEMLQLNGDIRATQSTGMIAYLTQADVDMKSQTVVSKVPVKVTFPDGVLDSNSMNLNIATRIVEFDGDVQVRMEQATKTTKTKPVKPGQSFAASFNSDQPVNITAPKLIVFNEKNLAYFSGGVTTDQAGSQMTSNELKIVFAKDTEGEVEDTAATRKKSDNQAAGKLSLIEAIGDVRILTADGRRASAAKLIYDSARQVLTLDENVTLFQQGNTLKGSRMVSDLAASITRFPPVGRVFGHFASQASDALPGKAKAAGTRPKSSPPSTGQFDLSSTRGKPVDIESDTLVMYDAKKLAEFGGNVKAVQGGMTMRSKLLKVNYGGALNNGNQGKKAGGNQITSIRAEGKVLINTADDQTVTSDWAFFDVRRQTVTIGGNVVLSQTGNVIKGEELVIDLKTSRSRFVNRGNPSKPQRVRGLFIPDQSRKSAPDKKSAIQ